MGRLSRITVGLTPAMLHRMDTLRALTGTSRAGFIRLALADYLRPLNPEGDQQ